jgi:imidazolonepropionase-like amidohydrolase
LILIVYWSCTSQNNKEAIYIVLKGATIIDGTGNRPIENGTIIIEGNKIKETGPAGQVKIPESSNIIDCKGKYIIPGMIDLHIHFWESARPGAQPTFIYDARKFYPYEEEIKFMKQQLPITLEKYLCSGVTSVVALGAIDWEYEIRKMADTTINSPRVFLAGGFIANYPTEIEWPIFDGKIPGYWIKNAEEAARLVDYLDSTGIDLIKAGYINKKEYPLESFIPKLKATAEESHRKNYRVSVHATELRSAIEVLKAGTDVLAHTVNDSIINDEFIALAKKNNAVITSSLGVISSYHEILRGNYILNYIDSCCSDPLVIKSWEEWKTIPADQKPPIPGWILQSGKFTDVMLQNIKKAYDAGLLICVGSDGGNIGSMHGPSFHRELRLLEKSGMKPMDILLAATRNGAIALGKQNELGTLEKGKLADLLILNANPLETADNYSNISYVMRNGNLIDRKSLTEKY